MMGGQYNVDAPGVAYEAGTEDLRPAGRDHAAFAGRNATHNSKRARTLLPTCSARSESLPKSASIASFVVEACPATTAGSPVGAIAIFGSETESPLREQPRARVQEVGLARVTVLQGEVGRRSGGNTAQDGPEETMRTSILRRAAVAGLAIASLGLTNTGAGAANDPLVVWQGGITITNVNRTCRTRGLPFGVGAQATSVFRPRLVGDEPPSALTMLFGRSAYAFVRQSGPDQMDGSGAYAGPAISGRATVVPGGVSGNYNFKISPNTITETTQFITMKGSVTNFTGRAGCTMAFSGAYSLRPN
jgi:hypothetical protein